MDKTQRGRGTGTELVTKALSWFKGLDVEVVFVTTDDAVGFYERFGFKVSRKNTWLLWTPGIGAEKK